MARLGVELGPRAIRGVRLEGWPRPRTQVVEVEWDRDDPGDAVRTLRETLGAADRPLLFTKRVKLPALPAAERRNILRLEPERFFAVRSEDLVPAVRDDDDLIFAAKEAQLAGWVAALEQIAPVDLVEPAPVALSRALARAPLHDVVALFDGRTDGIGLVEIRGGRVTSARRLFGDIAGAAAALAIDPGPGTIYLSPWSEDRARALAALLPSASLQPLPSVSSVTGPFLPAYGAALALDAPPDFARTLVSPELGRGIRTRHRREVGLAVAACAVALVFALTSIDVWRARATRELDAGLEALRRRAAPALALQARLETVARQAQAIRAIDAERADPLQVLLALSRELPPGAFVRGLRGSGTDWQLDGYAPNAARVLAKLGAGPEFRDVHFLSAMNRAQIGNQSYESFALAFRYVPAP
ncbi:MAG: hypothetical protein DMD36_19365 [Gemmatimonadetes bacterium]|nr:MAG: hypothetical protein DMD36_19365 [Gemmatimonadota bacterium]